MKGNKGITLIALVITIIVLLILAGVSIAMLSGDNSILSNATKSADYNKIGEVTDKIGLEVSENVTNFLNKKYNNDATYTGSATDVAGAVDEAINQYTESGAKKPTNGVTVTYASNKITVATDKYKNEATVSGSTVTWGGVQAK